MVEYGYTRVQDLTPSEKDQLLEELLFYLGVFVETEKYDGVENRTIVLRKR